MRTATAIQTIAPATAPSSSDVVAEIGTKLGLRRLGSRWRGRCPWHGGRSGKSFVLSEGKTAPVVFYCFAGCSYAELHAAIRDVVGDLLPAGGPIPEIVDSFRSAIRRTRWAGPGARTDRAVLLSHAVICERARSDQYGASVREIAEMAKVASPRTAGRSHARLVAAGWLECVAPGNRREPAIWRLTLPSVTAAKMAPTQIQSSDISEIQHPDPKITRGVIKTAHSSFPGGTQNGASRSPLSMSHAEAFRHGRGLGRAAGVVYGAIVVWGPVGARELARRLGYKQARPVQRQLAKLSRFGLVRRWSNGWCTTSKSEFQLADELGLDAEVDRQHERHAEERAYHRTAYAQYAGRTADGKLKVVMDDGARSRPEPAVRPRASVSTPSPKDYVNIKVGDTLDAAIEFLRRHGGIVIRTEGDGIRVHPPEISLSPSRRRA